MTERQQYEHLLELESQGRIRFGLDKMNAFSRNLKTEGVGCYLLVRLAIDLALLGATVYGFFQTWYYGVLGLLALLAFNEFMSYWALDRILSACKSDFGVFTREYDSGRLILFKDKQDCYAPEPWSKFLGGFTVEDEDAVDRDRS